MWCVKQVGYEYYINDTDNWHLDKDILGDEDDRMYSALTEAQYKNQMAQAVKATAETNGIRIQNRIAEQTADSLIYANIQANRARGLSSLWDSKNTNVLKNVAYSKDKALRDYYKWSSKQKQKDVNSYELRNAIDYGTRMFRGVGNSIGRKQFVCVLVILCLFLESLPVIGRLFLYTFFRTKSPSRLWSDIHPPPA